MVCRGQRRSAKTPARLVSRYLGRIKQVKVEATDFMARDGDRQQAGLYMDCWNQRFISMYGEKFTGDLGVDRASLLILSMVIRHLTFLSGEKPG